MGKALLVMADGPASDTTATRIDLLKIMTDGIGVENWRQAVNGYKGGGTFQSSSLSDGRQLVGKQFDTAVESFPISCVRGATQNIAIATLQNLFRLMEQASDYWANQWVERFVWIESRAECESNTRYALVSTARIPQLADVYSPTFKKNAVFNGMTLEVERRDEWSGNQPGTGTATPISSVEAWSGRNYGNVNSAGVDTPTTGVEEVFFSNGRQNGNITHVFTWSAANGFSANLVGGGFPITLLDTVGVAPQVNDAVYFGIQTVAGENYPIRSLVFDIATAVAGITWVWETRIGAGFGPVPAASFRDNTDTGGNPLDTLGVNTVVFQQFITMGSGTLVVNGVTALWVRLLVTAAPGPAVAPTQQNREVYTVSWSYIDIKAANVGGDLSAIASLGFRPQYDKNAINEVSGGLRSYDRGADFRSFLNCSDQHVPANVTLALGANCAYVSPGYGPTGRAVRYTPAGVEVMATRVKFTLAAPLAIQYYGGFHFFLRAIEQAGATSDFSVRLVITASSGGQSFSAPIVITGTVAQKVFDFGTFVLPLATLLTSEAVDELVFDVQAGYSGAGGVFIEFVDLCLIPSDEWMFDAFDYVLSADSDVEIGDELGVDSIKYPKRHIRSLMTNISTSNIDAVWGIKSGAPANLRNNARQRLWFTIFGITSGVRSWDSDIAMSIRINRNQRYLGPRGAR